MYRCILVSDTSSSLNTINTLPLINFNHQDLTAVIEKTPEEGKQTDSQAKTEYE